MRGSRNFRLGGGGWRGGGGGGGGGPGQPDKKAVTTVFFCPQLILQKSNGQSIIFQGSRGGPTAYSQ